MDGDEGLIPQSGSPLYSPLADASRENYLTRAGSLIGAERESYDTSHSSVVVDRARPSVSPNSKANQCRGELSERNDCDNVERVVAHSTQAASLGNSSNGLLTNAEQAQESRRPLSPEQVKVSVGVRVRA